MTASARAAISRALQRAELHDDPLRPVLEALSETLAALEAAREQVGPEVIDRVARYAALGARENVVAMVRAADARTRLLRAAFVVVVAVVASGLGYALGAAGAF